MGVNLFTPFSSSSIDWIKRMFEYGFIERIDYQSLSDFSEKPLGGRPQIEYALSIENF